MKLQIKKADTLLVSAQKFKAFITNSQAYIVVSSRHSAFLLVVFQA